MKKRELEKIIDEAFERHHESEAEVKLTPALLREMIEEVVEDEAPLAKMVKEGAASEGIQYEKDLGAQMANGLASYNLKPGIDFFIRAAGAGHGSDVSIMAKDEKTLVTGLEAKTSMGSDHGQFRFMYDLGGKGDKRFVLNKDTKTFRSYPPQIKKWTEKLWSDYVAKALREWEDPDPLLLALGTDFFGWSGEPFTMNITMPTKAELSGYNGDVRKLLSSLEDDEFGSTYEFTFPGRYIRSINSAYTGTKKTGFVCKKGGQCAYLVDWFGVSPAFWYRTGQRIIKGYFTGLWKDLSAPAPFEEVGQKYIQKSDEFIQGGDIGLWALTESGKQLGLPAWEGSDELQNKLKPYLRVFWKTSGSSKAEGGQRPLNAAIKFRGKPPRSSVNLLPITGKNLKYGSPQNTDKFYKWLAEKIADTNNNL